MGKIDALKRARTFQEEEQLTQDKAMIWFFYGPPRSGKTTLATSWISQGDVLLCSFEGNVMGVPNGTIVSVFSDNPTGQAKAYADFEDLLRSLIVEDHTIKTVIIDPLLHWESCCENYVMQHCGVKPGDSRGAYKQMTVKMSDVLDVAKFLKTKGISTIFIDHVYDVMDPTGKVTVEKVPSIFGKLKQKIPAICDMVGYCHKIPVVGSTRSHFVVDFGHNTMTPYTGGTLNTKDRTILKDRETDLTCKKIYDKIRSYVQDHYPSDSNLKEETN